ncbi:microtubule associated protein-domain-containing protein [Gigaspora margarita]|uniref:Microtubule associated protein-domain-containing protein n=1 Tax=Gigaspora margarita TaxID=4874 RepID=A0A8H4AHG0_GIGMA|nr:microtubule associated protein-domain-containing protein [Gigaspora margarita]
MDALHFKADQLKLLWSQFRIANASVDFDYGDQSEWARGKLQGVFSELDKLIQEQLLWKSKLAAEIEDLLVEIDDYCQLFGRRVDIIIPQAASLNIELNDATRDNLKLIRDSLQEESGLTRKNLDKWLCALEILVQELNEDYKVPSSEIFKTDLSSSLVLPIWHKYDEYSRAAAERREIFEKSAIKLHYYWNMLHYSPKDDVDELLFKLFADKSDPKDLYEALKNDNKVDENHESDTIQQEMDNTQREYVYYTLQLPPGLKLSPENIVILRNKLTVLEQVYMDRKSKIDGMLKTAKNFYDELKISPEERINLICSLDDDYFNKLSLEVERLRELIRNIVQNAVEQYTTQLGNLWDKCLVPQHERDGFLENVHKIDSAEEVYEYLAQEAMRLEELCVKCAKIFDLMSERRALIEKMIEFEKKASDPRRLFQSSFRLLEEEKWRKSCWPNLVKIEDNLINACITYEEAERKPFMYESIRFLDTLQEEISERTVNQMFFGFEKDAAKGSNQKQAKDFKNTTKPTPPPLSTPPSSGTRTRSSHTQKLTPNSSLSLSNSENIPNRSRRSSKVISRSVSPARSTTSSRATSRAPSRAPSPERKSLNRKRSTNNINLTPPLSPTNRVLNPDNSTLHPGTVATQKTNKPDDDKNLTASTQKTNKSNDDKNLTASRRPSVLLGKSNTTSKRSNSISSTSSESSSVSSVAAPSTPTTLAPSSTSCVVNGHLSVPTPSSKIKSQKESDKNTTIKIKIDKEENKSNVSSLMPTKATKTTTPKATSTMPLARKTNKELTKARPKSVVGQ